MKVGGSALTCAQLLNNILRIGTLLLLASCQSTPGLSGGVDTQFAAPGPLSDYLAAQQARMDNDTQRAADYYLAALGAAPPNSAVLRDRAYQLLISDGRFEEAIALQDDLRLGSLSYSLSCMVIVLDHIKARRYERALEALDSVSGTGFDLLLKPIATAWSHAGERDEDAAFAALESLNRHRAFGGFYLEHKAYLNAYFGDWDAAKALFARALEDRSKLSSRAVLDYAGRLSKRGASEDALAVIDTALAQAPQISALISAQERLQRGKRLSPLVRKPSDAVAEALYRTATELVRKPTATSAVLYARLSTYLQPKLEASHVLIADIYAAQGRLEAALDTIRSLDADGAMADVRVLRIARYLDRLERTDEAIDVLQAGLEKRPDHAFMRVSLADLYRRTSQFSDAIVLYSQAIEASDDAEWMLHYGRGIAHEQNGQFEKAEADLRRALELRPGDPYILNYLGYSLLDRGLKEDEARAMIDAAVAARPNDGFIVDSQGWAAYTVGDYEAAVALLERAVTLQPGDPTINDHLGDAYWKTGRYIEARFKWQQVLTMEPSNSQAQHIEAKLDLGLTLAEMNKSPGQSIE